MLFNSQIFLLGFLPIVVSAYWLLGRYAASGHAGFRFLLLIASWVFYAYWDIRLLPLLLVSIGLNFLLIQILTAGRMHRKSVLVFGLAVNLLTLGFFKYFNFFIDNLPFSLGPSAFGFEGERFNIILPLAISFFTFQQISSLVSAYKKNITPHSLLDYALYISFFPQLIAGPIVRHDQLIPQLQVMPDRSDIEKKFGQGLLLITLGLLKKVFIADQLSTLTTPLFDQSLTGGLSFIDAWTATFAFGFQIYFDFSGYSDMAIGLALLFGISLPVNFLSPYKASSLIDFWRRWHITLSTFLRDYLYIPLGGNRHGVARQYFALVATMLLGGLWHGAGWNFIIWGGLHGFGLMINHSWRRLGLSLPLLFNWSATFLFVMIAFLIFRAENLTSISNLLLSLAGLSEVDKGFDFTLQTKDYIVITGAFIVALLLPEPHQFAKTHYWKTPVAGVVFALLLVTVIVFLGGSFEQEFIYFQF